MKKKIAAEMTRKEFEEAVKEAVAVIVPVGSCEQHGYHLPLNTDNEIAEALGRSAAGKKDVILMPAVNYGQVWSARKIPGTIALSANTLKCILKDIAVSLNFHGARHVIFLSGHNGNLPVMKEMARELEEEKGFRNIWYFGPSVRKEVMDLLETKIPGNCVHAGELETSLMLAIHPELVQMDYATEEYSKMPAEGRYRPVSWDQFAESGAFGNAKAASAEKGEKILEYMIEELADLIDMLP